ncbi:hypothetical protein ACLHDD_17770 [Pantoea sp. NSTU24]
MDYTVAPCFRNPYPQTPMQLLKKTSAGFSSTPRGLSGWNPAIPCPR